jgi:hypothetical protein
MNQASSPAAQLKPQQRQQIALRVLTKQETISGMAEEEGVSRKFLYKQSHIAQNALTLAFEKPKADKEVLFYLPVTQKWLSQLILALILICHCSYRGVVELLRDLFDYSISIGTVRKQVEEAVQKARKINQSEDLSAIEVGLLDEIFQGSRPVLAGVDARSTYCFLLEEAEHRDEDTWGYYLLEAEERGLNPEYTIADGGKGIRAGQKAAWGDKPCHGDLWHIVEQGEALCRYLTQKAQGATTKRRELEAKMEKAKIKGEGHKFSFKLGRARQAEEKALKLASEVKTLFYWLRLDILSLAGPAYQERQELMNFIISELKIREEGSYKGIKVFRKALSKQGSTLLAFSAVLDQKLQEIAQTFDTSLYLVRLVCLLTKYKNSSVDYWQEWNRLHHLLPNKFHLILEAVSEAMATTPRTSSLVENLNSRLRNYFFLRKQLGSGYLDLLRFFLNHRTFMRSRHLERVGKSPAELMTGQEHPHWLELLGFERFQRA